MPSNASASTRRNDVDATFTDHLQRAEALRASEPHAALDHALHAIAIAGELGDPAMAADAHLAAGHCAMALDRLDAAGEHFERAADRARGAGDLAMEVRAGLGRAHTLLLEGAIDRVAALLLDLEPIAIRCGVPGLVGPVLNNLGNAFETLRQPHRALECFARAHAFARDAGERRSEALALSNAGAVLSLLGELDRAERSLDEAIAICRSIGNRDGEIAATGNLALCLEMQGRLDEALAGHRAVLAYFESVGDTENLLTCLTQIASLEEQRGNLDEARAMLTRALVEADRWPSYVGRWRIHGQLSSVYEKTGDAEGALRHYRRSAELRHELDAAVNRVALHELQRRLADGRSLADADVLDVLAERDRTLNGEAAPASRSGAAANGAQLDEAHRGEIVAALRRHVAQSPQSLSPDVRTALTAFIDGLEEPVTGEIERHVELRSEMFLQRLAARYPALSPAELRVCSLLRANLSTKEMAQMLNVSERNIESHRYSIRRKLALPSRQQLPTFLAAL